MDGYRRVFWPVAVLGPLLLSGPGCAWLRRPVQPVALPRVLPPSPRLEQVVEAVNRNSLGIETFATDHARLSVPGFPSLRASIAFERPKRLRMRAGTIATGTELDLGSNDALFWFWVMRQPPLYYCRHDQFAQSRMRHMVPIDPDWLVEAMGLAWFDPALPHRGPFLRSDGQLEIHTIYDTPCGVATRVTVVDAASAAVTEQRVYDAERQPIAVAVARYHRRDPYSGRIMPRTVDVRMAQTDFSLQIELGNVRINRPIENRIQLWTMPRVDDQRMVDLGDPSLQFAPSLSLENPASTLSSERRPSRRPLSRLLR
ncbi:MAG: hypothetical protein ACYTG0_32465 [Planctomycetota bacterium]|jgi:hypothetical protein